MNLDFVLLNKNPTVITDKSYKDEKSFHQSWKHYNRLSLMFMGMIVANNIKSSILQIESVRKYMMFVKKCFHSTDKSLAGTLMIELTTMKFDGVM